VESVRVSVLRNYATLLGVAGLIVVLDQWTKELVRASLALGESWTPLEGLLPYVRVIHWQNTGAAFGLFPAGGIVFTAVAIVVALGILYYWPQAPRDQTVLRSALMLQLGGAVGNLIDRLTLGTVTDFVAIGAFPVFNIADASISVGVLMLVLATWLEERARRAVPAGGGGAGEEGDAPGDV
jgi:signal peptidase II